nr:CST complex subunit TEN1 isoform X1 [Anser cygnoides]
MCCTWSQACIRCTHNVLQLMLCSACRIALVSVASHSWSMGWQWAVLRGYSPLSNAWGGEEAPSVKAMGLQRSTSLLLWNQYWGPPAPWEASLVCFAVGLGNNWCLPPVGRETREKSSKWSTETCQTQRLCKGESRENAKTNRSGAQPHAWPWHKIVLQLQDQPVPQFPILQHEKTQDYPLNLTAWHRHRSSLHLHPSHSLNISIPTLSQSLHSPFFPLPSSLSAHAKCGGNRGDLVCCLLLPVLGCGGGRQSPSVPGKDAARRTQQGRQAAPAAPWLGGRWHSRSFRVVSPSTGSGTGWQELRSALLQAQRWSREMLPGAGVYYFPWEINSSVPEGEALRTFGRLCCYNLARSEAILSAQHSAAQHHVCVDTRLVEPFEAQLGSLYMVLGEAEHREGENPVIKARILTCVEGMNVPLLEQAIQEQRKYFSERQQRMGTDAS